MNIRKPGPALTLFLFVVVAFLVLAGRQEVLHRSQEKQANYIEHQAKLSHELAVRTAQQFYNACLIRQQNVLRTNWGNRMLLYGENINTTATLPPEVVNIRKRVYSIQLKVPVCTEPLIPARAEELDR